jgi:choline dehydrogenase-like flavoprotein
MASHRREYDVCIIGGGIVGTHVGRLLASRGRRVAILERGPRDLSGLRPPTPRVECVQRVHGGVTNARNQVLGGNAHFWGGGLMRSDSSTVEGALGFPESEHRGRGEDLSADFDEAERALGLRHTLLRGPLGRTVDGLDRCDVAEIAVLPGRARNVAAAALDAIRASSGCDVYCDASGLKISTPTSAARVDEVTFDSLGVAHRVAGGVFVISAGAADSNLLVASQLVPLGQGGSTNIGVSLHDHFSVPLFRMRPDPDGSFSSAIAPTFEDGVIVGRHFEMDSGSGWGARGFLHFQFYFDEVSPYREIKSVLALRQQRAGPRAILPAVARMLPQVGRLSKIGYSRFVKHRLHLSPAVPVVATLDFETYPSAKNRFSGSADARPALHWDVREEDVVTFIGLAERCRRLVSDFCKRFGAAAEPLADWSAPAAAEGYLRSAATDAYHLGGGLAVGHDRDGVVDLNLRLRGTDNIYVISSAVFKRPGVANPTLTLLALANRFARQLK